MDRFCSKGEKTVNQRERKCFPLKSPEHETDGTHVINKKWAIRRSIDHSIYEHDPIAFQAAFLLRVAE
jgi:hypothetical protein